MLPHALLAFIFARTSIISNDINKFDIIT